MKKEQIIQAADAFARREAEKHILDKKMWYDFAYRCFMAGVRFRNKEETR